MDETLELTPANVEKSVDEYITASTRSGIFPDYAGMLRYLKKKFNKKFSELTALEKDPEYEEIFIEAMYRRESYLSRAIATDSKKATGCKILLTQPENGGYQEKNAKSDKGAGTEIVLKVEGVGGMEAFK